MRRLWRFSFLVILALSLSAVDAFSQTPPQPETRVGCLMNGRSAGTFVLVDEITGARLDVTGTNLGRFTETGGSRVTLTGTLIRQGTTDVFQATAAEQNRELCAPIAFSTESQKIEIGKARLGIRGGLGLDPELVMVGAQAQFGPSSNRFGSDPQQSLVSAKYRKSFHSMGTWCTTCLLREWAKTRGRGTTRMSAVVLPSLSRGGTSRDSRTSLPTSTMTGKARSGSI
jgi:hypothetical protein